MQHDFQKNSCRYAYFVRKEKVVVHFICYRLFTGISFNSWKLITTVMFRFRFVSYKTCFSENFVRYVRLSLFSKFIFIFYLFDGCHICLHNSTASTGTVQQPSLLSFYSNSISQLHTTYLCTYLRLLHIF